MALGFHIRDVMHRISAKFYPSRLPGAKKTCNLRAVHQPELDIHDVASKAEMYNITIDPEIIEKGTTAFMQLITYLAADGYRIKTPIFSLKVSIPGEYDGTETHLPDGIRPQGRLLMAPELRRYLREHVEIQILGMEDTGGFISKVLNRITGKENETIHPDAPFEIFGKGLKIATDERHADDTGIYLESAADGTRVRINPLNVIVNRPTRLAVIAPTATETPEGSKWYVVVRTQESAKEHGGQMLQYVREMKSNFILTIQ